MWDNVPLLRGIAAALFFFSVVAVLYGMVHYVVHLPQLLPIQSVRLSAAPERVVAEDVLKVVRQEVQGNFFTVDIERLRLSLENISWVRKVSIRREFPDRLAVQFEEHQPLAHWNEAALVNQQGEVFVAETTQVLPVFTGYEGSSAEISQQYQKFSQQLAGLNLQLTQLVLSPRHAWQLHLSNDMVVELGRESMQQRLARFVTIYPYSLGVASGTEAEQVKWVDMRYRNGFAVRMRQGNA
ncbi:MAG: cell division protein FtsQ/DivIB [Gallionella sp.]|nr:cell division protein FtsQ/DivIB [Gallionella sp.]